MDTLIRFRGEYTPRNAVMLVVVMASTLFLASCCWNQKQNSASIRSYGGVWLEYYSDEQAHPQLLQEIKRQKEKYPDPNEFSTLYLKDGHLYTTYIVARLAGFDKSRAYLLSYFSQLPDEEKEFTGVCGAFSISPTHRRQIMSTLHSLHGGSTEAVLKRQRTLQSLVANMIRDKTSEDWKIGIVLHSYADSFAHTYMKEGRLVAYDRWVGHLWHGHRPDTIAFYPEKYKSYVAHLFDAINVKNKDKVVLTRIFDLIPMLTNDRRRAVDKFRELAETLEFEKEDYNEIGEQTRKRLDNKDIEGVIDLMEHRIRISGTERNDVTMMDLKILR